MLHKLQELTQTYKKKIRRVVSSGGGAKGVVYPGAYKAMIDTGIIMGVEEFSGASAGAITSTFMALSMPQQVLREKLLSTNLQDLLGSGIGHVFGKNQPGISFLTKDGKPLETFIRENIIETIRNSFVHLDHLDELIIQHSALKKLVSKIRGTDPQITFSDLALLNAYFPRHFKQLTMPAVKFPNGEVQIFNSKLTPDVEIALACRASASIPVILEPVEIEINGVKQKFVDGGLFDGLPTDYFDIDEKGNFTKNKIPEQTLVYAFSDGTDNKKNPVFQAIYGQLWDQVITEEILEKVLLSAIEFARNLIDPEEGLNSAEEETLLLSHAVKLILEQYVMQQLMSGAESKIIMSTMKESIDSLLLTPKNNPEFWQSHKAEKNEMSRIKLLAAFVKEKMKPVLFDANIFERLKRNVLMKVLGNLVTPYKNTDQEEIAYQKLRSDYVLRTVELRVGNIKITDFNEATQYARVMDSLGYLDTINYITNHELHNPKLFNSEQFYLDLITNFEAIHNATLLGAGKIPDKDPLNNEINLLRTKLKKEDKPDEIISRQIYQLIKDKAESQIDGVAAFALSRTVEFQNKILTAEELFKETYEEGFKRSGFFSVSNITGEQIFRSNTLHESLKIKNMFDLYKQQAPHEQKTRSDKVFEALNKLANFNRHTDVPQTLQKAL